MLGVGSARGSRRRFGSTLVLWAIGLAAACGGESSQLDPARGSGGSAGALAMGGSAGRGTMGCPPVAPRTIIAEGMCPAGLPADGCKYTLECSSGPHEFSYQCGLPTPDAPYETWTVSGECILPNDFCWGGDAQIRCAGGNWQLMGWGGDPPPPCPEVRPTEGSSCSYSIFSGPPTCGYVCPGSDVWSVGSCGAAAETSVWLYDGACEGATN